MSTQSITRMPARPGPVPLGHPDHPKTRKPAPPAPADAPKGKKE
jgi:hypothetical protein